MSGFALGAKARAAGYRLRAFDTIGSTNNEALEAARAGDPGGLWFAALQQTNGRGRRGRPWASPYGNLAASLLIIPDAAPETLGTIGFVAGVALNTALSQSVPGAGVQLGLDAAAIADGQGRFALKWPNDVLADGAKLAGILLEAQALPDGRRAIVIGIGVNVVAAPAGTPYPATSLAELGATVTAQDVFAALSEAWVAMFALWRDGHGTADVLARWRSCAAGLGAPVAVQRDGEVIRGIFESIDDDGRLIVRDGNNARIAITAGDVHFGATASARS
ncbi:biotin--[acetyl-CoA-carboxylase] ligase [Devosia pacifica]|uniref:biotin--[biotin carboxyl-carrier protein] ligase n=1 Tax=Devosia pacifica TaxID=1335967 RepID=A0A918RUI7_9HYPH|nr:biotin--[acetyl-CoA-carboxylase] ligase [Devosia pacifica]GHA10587.1 biotin--[acetyl-CoA-carboxylase] ligase [Devosia pacifica]